MWVSRGQLKFEASADRGFGHPTTTCLFVGGSNTTLTLRLPQAGQM